MYNHGKTLGMGVLPALILTLCVSLAVDTTYAQSKKEEIVQSEKRKSKIIIAEMGQQPAFTVIDDNTGLTRLHVGADGNVGIGTTSPNEQLEITGNFRLPTSTATTGIIMSGGNWFIHNFGSTTNFFAGVTAGNLAMSGVNNTGVGNSTLFNNTTGNDNTAMGVAALNNNITGSNNTAIGRIALFNNTTGSGNTATGRFALGSNTTGNNNTANGAFALSSNTTGVSNTANGAFALQLNTTGVSNTANGGSALFNNTTGNNNTAMGVAALNFNTTGFSNTAMGVDALNNNITGSNNTAIGRNADVGAQDLTNATAIGANAVVGASNSLVLGGTGPSAVNVGIGTTSPTTPLHITSNSISSYALRIDQGTSGNGILSYVNTTSSARTLLAATSNVSGLHVKGNGYVGIGESNPGFPLDMGSGAHVTVGGVWTDASSREYKENIRELTTEEALVALQELRPTRFNYKVDQDEEYVGFIAEDVPELVASKGRKGLSPMDVVAVLTKVVQQQQEKIEELEARLNDVE